ncbi:MAG: energy transducer TonB [Terracidiphilus sp.]|jgi:TonB family protein
MKAKTCFLVLSALFATSLSAQTEAAFQHQWRIFHQQLLLDKIYGMISPEVAETLIIHKEELAWNHRGMEARIAGTVVVGIEISKDGSVRHPIILSGPLILQQAVLDAVRKYKFKPYLINGEAFARATWLNVEVSNYDAEGHPK